MPATLTLGTGETVTQDGASALITSSGNAQNAVINQGTIDAGFSGGTFTLADSGAPFTNDGTIVVGNGDTLNAATAISRRCGKRHDRCRQRRCRGFRWRRGHRRGTGFHRRHRHPEAAPAHQLCRDDRRLRQWQRDRSRRHRGRRDAIWSAGTLTISNAGSPIATLSLLGDYTGDQFIVASDNAGGSLVTVTATCYAAGTRILTPRGEIAIERLRAGDLVQTISGRAQPIDWIGHRRVDFRRHPNRDRVLPVRIAAHAFGPDRPRRELLLSPDHAVFVEDVLIPIRHLINGTTVAQITRQAITYYHIELPRHDVLLANGMPAESYLEAGARDAFANGGRLIQLHPDFAPPLDHYAMLWEAQGYAPLVVTGAALERAREALARQAQRYPRSPRSRGASSRTSAPAA